MKRFLISLNQGLGETFGLFVHSLYWCADSAINLRPIKGA